MGQDVRPLIFTIDDAPVTLNLTVAILKRDYRLRPFACPLMAFKYLSRPEAETDLVLLDYQMPQMSGPEVFRRLKQYPATASAPVIFMTGMTDQATGDELLAAGAAGLVAKPPTAPVLLKTIKSILDCESIDNFQPGASRGKNIPS